MQYENVNLTLKIGHGKFIGFDYTFSAWSLKKSINQCLQITIEIVDYVVNYINIINGNNLISNTNIIKWSIAQWQSI